MEDPEDVERAIKKSKIKYDSKGRLADVRSQADIESYRQWQAGNRQRNAELKEYERMKAYYAGREDEMPYKTLAAFRRARRSQSKTYKESRKEWGYKTEKARIQQIFNETCTKYQKNA